MEVAKILVTDVCTRVLKSKKITSGMIGATVSFVFDDTWDGLTKTVVYRCGGVTKDETIEGTVGTIPAEVLAKSGWDLMVGVYGTCADDTEAIPTLWANLGRVHSGADPSGDLAADPSLPIWAQILAKLGNLADLSTEAKENLVAAINEALTKGGGEVDPEEIGRIVDEYLEQNPPAAYTLPIATETTLGGVKAAAATEEMTQPVGITAEGKLVTVPCQDSGGNVNKGWTTEQINLLDQLFNHIHFNSSEGGAIADALIASLRSGDTGGGEEEPDEPTTPEKTLTSISATYSGGDVAAGTAVTALTGIVVTAHYSDGASTTVTGYSLSGTIAEGSNTVTVSYGGKTTTFTVTGIAESEPDEPEVIELPDGYTQLAYISSNGSSSFDTGIAPTLNTDAEYKVNFSDITAYYPHILAAHDGGLTFHAYPYATMYSSETPYWNTFGGSGKDVFGTVYTNTDYTVKTMLTTGKVTINDVGMSVNVSQISTTTNLDLFGATDQSNSPVWHMRGKMYYCKIWENGTLVRYFVPCSDSDGNIGMYDVVEGKFYTSETDSKFIGGDPV